MKIPKWLMNWLTSRGIAIEGFKALLDSVADKVDAPEEWKAAVSVWIDENSSLDSETILAAVALMYAEIKSGAPGYDAQHGGGS